MNFSPELQTAIQAACNAGAATFGLYQKKFKQWEKTDSSPVTEADIAAEKIIFDTLKKHFPYPMLSEETRDTPERLASRYVWMVDPLDGTKEFIKGLENFSVLVGLSHNHEPTVGVIYKPVTQELFVAEKGKGAWKQDSQKKFVPIHVSTHNNLFQMTLCLSPEFSSKKQKIVQYLQAKEVVEIGSVGVRIARIAEGSNDIYFGLSNYMSEWDTCAADIILREAGGRLTDTTGATLRYNQKDISRPHGLIASNGQIHDSIVQKINDALTSMV